MEDAIPKAALVHTLFLMSLMTACQAAAQTQETLTAAFTLRTDAWADNSIYGAGNATSQMITDAPWVDASQTSSYMMNTPSGLLFTFKLLDTSIKSADCKGTVPNANPFTTATGPIATALPRITLVRGRDGGDTDNPINVTCKITR